MLMTRYKSFQEQMFYKCNLLNKKMLSALLPLLIGIIPKLLDYAENYAIIF